MFARRESFIVASMVLGIFACFATGCGSDDAESTAPSANLPSGDGDTSAAGTGSATTPDGARTSTFGQPRQMPQEDLHPKVIFETTHGVIKVRLDREKARATVDNFLQNYVDLGIYDNTIFHEVDKGFMALGGGYTAELEAVPMRSQIHSEAHNGLKNRRGTIAMARDRDFAHSATSQFFFNLVDNPALDHIGRESAADYGYCVFGEIVEGEEVLDKIAEVPTESREEFKALPVETVRIESVRRLR